MLFFKVSEYVEFYKDVCLTLEYRYFLRLVSFEEEKLI